MLLRSGIRIGRPFGIPLRVHGSWFPAAGLLVAHFATTVYAETEPAGAVALGVVSTLAFFACLLAHELGHAVTARALGIGVVDITLFVFGGVARIAREPSRPAQEIVIALAGPVVSLGIGVGALSLAGGTTGTPSELLWTIGIANIALAAFNMLPGFPLDGGRVLRAVLWSRSGNLYRATLRAGRMGQSLGIFLAASGLLLFVFVGGPNLNTGAIEGLWLAVVGIFLLFIATGARRAARVAATFDAESAGRWARPFAGTLPVDASLARVAVDGGPYAVTENGRLAGIVLPHALVTPVGSSLVRDVMVPWSPRLSFPAAKPLTRALERLAGSDSGVLVVVDDNGTVVGILDADGVRSKLRTGER